MPFPGVDYCYLDDGENSSNPYDGCGYTDEYKCDYTIPTPEFYVENSKTNVPPPKESKKEKFSYKMKNGRRVVFDHPLPPGFPIDMYDIIREDMENHDEEEIDERYRPVDLFYYGGVALFPFAGFIFFKMLHPTRPQLAQRLLNFMMGTFVAWGVLLFCALL